MLVATRPLAAKLFFGRPLLIALAHHFPSRGGTGVSFLDALAVAIRLFSPALPPTFAGPIPPVGLALRPTASLGTAGLAAISAQGIVGDEVAVTALQQTTPNARTTRTGALPFRSLQVMLVLGHGRSLLPNGQVSRRSS